MFNGFDGRDYRPAFFVVLIAEVFQHAPVTAIRVANDLSLTRANAIPRTARVDGHLAHSAVDITSSLGYIAAEKSCLVLGQAVRLMLSV